MKPPIFDYHSPSSVREAIQMLADLGPDAKVIAGGQSLMPMLNMRLARPAHLVDINRIESLASLEVDGQWIRVGAITRQRVVERSEAVTRHCPLLAKALPFISHPPIRNRGTVVGSITHADSAAELPAVLAVLAGKVHAVSREGEREIPAEDFFVGSFETSLRSDELVSEVLFPVSDGDVRTAFLEISRRHGDFAICGVAAVVAKQGRSRLAFTGVGPVPKVVDVTDAVRDSVEGAVGSAVAGLDPPEDIHASADYRRHLARVLAARALNEALDQKNARDAS